MERQTASEEKFEKARSEIKKILAQEETETTSPELRIPVEEEKQAEADEAPARQKRSAATENIARLYHSSQLGDVDMTTIERRDPNRRKKIIAWVIVGLFVLAGAAVAGFYIFVNQPDTFTGKSIVIAEQLPPRVTSGDEFSFTVAVRNNEAVDLTSAELTIQFPEGFRFISSEPSPINEAHNAWSVSTIKSQAAKQVVITGQLFGDIGATKNFSTLLTYVPANFNSEFQTSHAFAITVNDSVIDLDLELPVKIISGHEATYRVTYTNNAEEPLERLRLTLTLPSDLTTSNVEPQPTAGSTIWETATLAGRESRTVSFQGIVSAEEGAMREIKAAVGYVDSNGEYHPQVEGTSIIFVVNPQLVLTLSVNGSTNNTTASFGETLAYVLTYQNESQSEIDNMSLSVELASPVLEWDKLDNPQRGQVNDKTIRWDETTVPALRAVKPGEGGEVRFTLPVANSVPAEGGRAVNYSVVSQAKAFSEKVVDLEGSSLEVESNSLTVLLNTQLELRAEGRYYDDEYLAVGRGPVPPEVGKKTTYRVYWYLQNSTNEVKDVIVSAVLPSTAAWAADASVSAGDITYEAATRRVTWTINKIPPHVGQSIPELEAWFAMSVTPTSKEVGEALTLVGQSHLRAADSFTEEEIIRTREAITTALETDPLAAGKGTVIAGDTATNTNSQ